MNIYIYRYMCPWIYYQGSPRFWKHIHTSILICTRKQALSRLLQKDGGVAVTMSRASAMAHGDLRFLGMKRDTQKTRNGRIRHKLSYVRTLFVLLCFCMCMVLALIRPCCMQPNWQIRPLWQKHTAWIVLQIGIKSFRMEQKLSAKSSVDALFSQFPRVYSRNKFAWRFTNSTRLRFEGRTRCVFLHEHSQPDQILWFSGMHAWFIISVPAFHYLTLALLREPLACVFLNAHMMGCIHGTISHFGSLRQLFCFLRGFLPGRSEKQD